MPCFAILRATKSFRAREQTFLFFFLHFLGRSREHTLALTRTGFEVAGRAQKVALARATLCARPEVCRTRSQMGALVAPTRNKGARRESSSAPLLLISFARNAGPRSSGPKLCLLAAFVLAACSPARLPLARPGPCEAAFVAGPSRERARKLRPPKQTSQLGGTRTGSGQVS